MADDDSTDPAAPDPASLAEARPDSDRGQGTTTPSPADAISEAASEGVSLTDDGTGVVTRTGGTGAGTEG